MIIRYCQACAGEVEKISDTEYKCPVCGAEFWNNPSTTVAIVLIRDGKILVAKRGREPRKGTYDLPGGFLDYGEDLFVAAKREMQEEAGIIVDDFEILTAYSGIYEPNDSICDIIVLANSWQGDPVAADDVEAFAWEEFSFLDDAQFSAPYHGLSALLSKRFAHNEVAS